MRSETITRRETKYILSKDKYESLMKEIIEHLEKDFYYQSKICNIYFDTDNYDLIINSLNKPLYKEKVRLRSYDIPNLEDYVFLEIKKKYNGIVGKRRIRIKLKDFYEYIENGYFKENDQIRKEIDYCFKYYDLKPKMFLAYDRLSYYDKDNQTFRITFDYNIRSRENNLRLEDGDEGDKYFNEDIYIMETKVHGSYPLWFTETLSKLKIYPQSFSKYGSIYGSKMKEENYV